jgi:hypothetical protein
LTKRPRTTGLRDNETSLNTETLKAEILKAELKTQSRKQKRNQKAEIGGRRAEGGRGERREGSED